MEPRRKPTPVWLARGEFRGGVGGQKATQMAIDAPALRPRATTSKLDVGSFPPRRRPPPAPPRRARQGFRSGAPRRRPKRSSAQRAARENAKLRSNRLGENRREAIIFGRCDEQGLSGYRQGQKGMVGAARFQRETQSCGSMLSTSMDSLAVSLQSGSTNYESNSTPVPEIVNQSRNCAPGKSLDFNERESHKLRLSDTGLALHWRTATAEAKKINEDAPARQRCRRPKLVRSMSTNESAKLARVRS